MERGREVRGSRKSKKFHRRMPDSDDEKEEKIKPDHQNVDTEEPSTTHQLEDDLETSLDYLYEKRSSTREAGLRGLTVALIARVMTQFIDDNHEPITHQTLSSIRHGSSPEAALAGRALCMVSVTSGVGKVSEHVFKESFPQLVRISKLGPNAEARISAIEALAMLTFVGGVEEADTESAMEVLWQIIAHKGNAHADQTLGTSKPTAAIKAAAIGAWSLLLSILGSKSVAALHCSSVFGVMSSLLEDPDLSVRVAAGEAMAVLCEGDTDLGFMADDESGCASVETKKKATAVDQMKALAASRSRKGQTKKERSEQRSSFRGIVAAVEGGECPETCLKLKHGDTVRISSWGQTVRLNAFRRLLGDGFQRHLQENSLLHEVFGFAPREAPVVLDKESSKAQRHQTSVASKMKTQLMKEKRCAAASTLNLMNEESFQAVF